jgi:hypothetical protein
MRNLFSTLTAFALAALLVSGAQAATKVWQAFNGSMGGNWNDTNHWVGGVIPSPGNDDVQFPANSVSANTQYVVTLNVGNAEVLFVDMHTDARLDIGANTFKLGTADTTPFQTSNIAGTIRLDNASSVLQFNFSHLLAPKTISAVPVYGSIDGEKDAASIQIANGKQLTSQITIQGALQMVPVSGSATFLNDTNGLLHANFNDVSGNETLLINPGALGAGAGMFRVSVVGAFLQLNNGNTSLTGDFKVSNGTLDIYSNITTSGGVCFTGGKIKVTGQAGVTRTFIANGAPVNCP